MIPIPPSHCVNWRHMRIERGRSSGLGTTLDPVVVKPDIATSIEIGSWTIAIVKPTPCTLESVAA